MHLNTLSIVEIKENAIGSVDRVHPKECGRDDPPMIWRDDGSPRVLEDMDDVIAVLLISNASIHKTDQVSDSSRAVF
jgi:hypothetical protein